MGEVLRIAIRRFDPFERAIARQFADFAAGQSVEVALEAVPMDLNALHASLFAGHGLADGSFDIAFLNTDWLAEAQAGGLIEDLEPWLAKAPIPDFPDAWSPSLTGLQRFAGGFWGMPYHDGPECLIYRRDLLEAAGLAVPQSWEAFHAAARVLNDPAGGISGTVLALFPDGHNGFYDFCIHIWSRGGAPFDATGRPRFTGTEAEAALDFLRTLARDRDAVPADVADLDSVAAGLRFCEGRVAMMANWFGFAALGEAADSPVRGLIDVAPLPAGAGGESISLNVFWVLAIGAGSGRKALAWDFLRHCATAGMDRITTDEGAIGVRRSTWADPQVNARVPYSHRLDWLHTHARHIPVRPDIAAISGIVDDMIGAAIGGDRPTPELLAEAQARVEALAA
ncbi:extracellular solute-binding protein [Sphingomonas psychrotolerans]|uniref:Sugar ABC transporter substrate-binding protein n=1 Tax=Sphingomonas psychrotolerans TaxID=1327635 RepID=A0A2K8MMZ0_9SPHN|nr:extracellular solute-binding protein [Sphingomonas psychrotolerans]ATY32691.1 sugar ABC transporter substrate-binding protein [Sphingomonas psychrotolerans]